MYSGLEHPALYTMEDRVISFHKKMQYTRCGKEPLNDTVKSLSGVMRSDQATGG
jgi:hypothetical protein